MEKLKLIEATKEQMDAAIAAGIYPLVAGGTRLYMLRDNGEWMGQTQADYIAQCDLHGIDPETGKMGPVTVTLRPLNEVLGAPNVQAMNNPKIVR